MNLHAAAHLARELIAAHGLAGWAFGYDHARRRFGKCDYAGRRITLSRPLTFLNAEAEVRDTLLHEIAHALTPGAGHGPRWRAACRRVGCRPARCYTEAQVVSPPRPPAPYQLGCPACGWWVDRRRRMPAGRAYRCTRCRGDAVFRERVVGGEARSPKLETRNSNQAPSSKHEAQNGRAAALSKGAPH